MAKKNIPNPMSISLSGDQIKSLVPYPINIYQYPDIKHFKNIDDLLRPSGATVILFNTNETNEGMFGHWTCLLKTIDDDNNDSINFFDSYGIVPDDEKKMINKHFMNIIGQTANYLSKLLLDAKTINNDVVEYNEKKLQQMKPNINTCGRHVAIRLILKDLSMNDYQKFMDQLKSKYKKSPDEIVTILTDPVLNGQMTSYDLAQLLSELLI